MSAQYPINPSRKRQRFEGSENGETEGTAYHRAARECNPSATTSDSCLPAVAQPMPVLPAELLVGPGLYTDSAGRLWTLHGSSWWGTKHDGAGTLSWERYLYRDEHDCLWQPFAGKWWTWTNEPTGCGQWKAWARTS